MPKTSSLRLVGSTGANRAMEAELKRLARRAFSDVRLARPKRVDEQTLVYPYDRDLAWLAVNYLRAPSRVLWDLYEARAERLEPLYDEVRAWMASERRSWFADGASLSVRAKDIRAYPASASQIQGTVKNAIIDGAADAAARLSLDPETPDIELSVRGTGGPLVISVDLGGRSLHERGYRLDRVEASLRENVAAQILLLARWDARHETLIDPMCGSGTFAVEAAEMATGARLWVAPRRPAADRLAEFSDCDHALPPLFEGARPIIIANDIHTPAVRATRNNLTRANASDRVLTLHGDLRDLDAERLRREIASQAPDGWPEEPTLDRGLIVCNPPYGQRLRVDPEPLYEDLSAWCDDFGEGWRAAVIVDHPEFERIFDRRPMLKKPMPSGALRPYLYVYDLSQRPEQR